MFVRFSAALALSAPVPKAIAAELKWKFTEGDPVFVTTCLETSTSVTAAGRVAQVSTGMSEILYQAAVTAVDAKEVTLEVEFLSAKCVRGVAGPKKTR